MTVVSSSPNGRNRDTLGKTGPRPLRPARLPPLRGVHLPEAEENKREGAKGFSQATLYYYIKLFVWQQLKFFSGPGSTRAPFIPRFRLAGRSVGADCWGTTTTMIISKERARELRFHIAAAAALGVAFFALMRVGPAFSSVVNFFWPLLLSTGFFLAAVSLLLRISPPPPSDAAGDLAGEELMGYVAGGGQPAQDQDQDGAASTAAQAEAEAEAEAEGDQQVVGPAGGGGEEAREDLDYLGEQGHQRRKSE